MDKDIKVIDTLREIEQSEKNASLPFHPLAFFAEAVAMTRREKTGLPIVEIAKCFKMQFDEAELKAFIRELSNK